MWRLVITCVFICTIGHAQFGAPQFSSFGATSIGVSTPMQPSANPSYPVQASAGRAMGTPNANDRYQQIREIEEEESSAGYDPEAAEENYYNSELFAAKTKGYTNALNDISAMLNGKQPLSVRRAYYELENAYGNAYMSYDDFNRTIDESANFIKQWMAEKKLNPKGNEELNYAIQHFMGDTLTITLPVPDSKEPPKRITHLPFKYDYIDFKGEEDYRNYFVTKCLATGYGQCNSMPIVYLCLAEALGAKAYLSFAPHHSLIKYADAKGNMHNYEPTSNYHITDRWYEDYLSIKAQAMKSGIYLHPLNSRKVVANCMVDLAIGYMNKYGIADGKFITQCLNNAKQGFGGSPDVYINLTYSSLMAGMTQRALYYAHARSLADTATNPKARHYYDELQKSELTLKQLGYQEIPAQAYTQMMQSDSAKGNQQNQNGLNTKQARSLFITTK